MKLILAICFQLTTIHTAVFGDLPNDFIASGSISLSDEGKAKQTAPRVLLEATDSTSTSENSGIPEHLSITYQLVGNQIANDELIELVFKAHLTHHSTIMYSSDSLCAFGPIPTALSINGEVCEQIGPLVSLNAKEHSDEFFECDYKYFEDDIELRQQVKLKDISKPLDMVLSYQLCNDEKGFCLNLEHAIVVDLKKIQD
jgi:hypothetical protein